LPIPVDEGSLDRGFNVVPCERGECEDCSAPNCGLVIARRQDCREPTIVADCTERRGGCLANERLVVRPSHLDQAKQSFVSHGLLLSTCPCGGLGNGRFTVLKQREKVDRRSARGEFRGAAPNLWGHICERGHDVLVIESVESVERTQRSGPYARIGVGDVGTRQIDIAVMTSDDHGPASVGDSHCWSRFVSQMTERATPNAITIAAMIPPRIPMPPLATIATARRSGPGRR
jgi:hypothetical protein